MPRFHNKVHRGFQKKERVWKWGGIPKCENAIINYSIEIAN